MVEEGPYGEPIEDIEDDIALDDDVLSDDGYLDHVIEEDLDDDDGF